MKRKVNYLFIAIILFISLITNVKANTIDLSKKGSITVTLKEKSENVLIDGAEITIYHIGDASIKDNNLVFNKREELTCDVSLDNFKDTKLVSDISKCINDNIIKYVGTTDNGKVTFNNLNQGLYLVTQTKSTEGYSDIDSFLVAIPKVEDNKWVYDAKAKPKTDIYQVIDVTVLKKWNTDSKDLPNEVTIELYESDTLVDSIKLNDDNNWTYTWKNIKLSDKYSVKEVNIPKGYTPSYKVNEYVFTVTNTGTLAFTGQIFYPIIVLSILGIILILAGIKLIKDEA